MKLIISSFLLAVLCGCSTMNFVNGPELGDTVKREQWHHLAIGSLVEVSKPFDVDYHCDDKQWEKISVKLTLPNVLANSTLPYFSLYSPWTIEYECRESID